MKKWCRHCGKLKNHNHVRSHNRYVNGLAPTSKQLRRDLGMELDDDLTPPSDELEYMEWEYNMAVGDD